MTRPVDLLLDTTAHPVIAHRGGAADVPENTMAAFEHAVSVGAEAIELDVHVTADGVPVVIHDPRLDRTTDRTGAVALMSFSTAREADAGARFTADGGRTFPWRDRGVRVPALAEVLDAFTRLPVIVEIKVAVAAAAVRDVIVRAGAIDRCLMASFDGRALYPFDAEPWVRSASRDEMRTLLAGMFVGRAPRSPTYRALTIPSRVNGVPLPMRRLAGAARRAGCPTHIWVVDRSAQARVLWDRGVAGIITNRPAEILAARGARISR